MKRTMKGMARLAWLALLSGLTACSQEVLLDEGVQEEVCVEPIEFGNGFVDQAVSQRALSYQLSDYSTTMGVWGWQTVDGGPTTLLFSNHPVYYTASAWTYAPERYWDTGSSYRFHAYAPHHTAQKGGSAEPNINVVNYRIAITGVQLHGDNLQQEASHGLRKVFTETLAPHDVDWMVARVGQSTTGMLRPMVAFNLQHVLAKINVRLRLSDALVADPDLVKVTVNSLSISHLAFKGDYIQLYDATPSSSGIEEEWTVPSGTPLSTLLRDQPCEADGSWLYILESLLIPQAIQYDAEVCLVYTATYSDARNEQTTYRVPLREVFSAVSHFISGNSYTLSFLIAPETIQFDAGAGSWTDESAAEDVQ